MLPRPYPKRDWRPPGHRRRSATLCVGQTLETAHGTAAALGRGMSDHPYSFDPLTLWLAEVLTAARACAREAHGDDDDLRRLAMYFMLGAADVAARRWAQLVPRPRGPSWAHFDVAAWLDERRRAPDWSPERQAMAVASLLGLFTFLHRRGKLDAEVAAAHLARLEHHINEPLRRLGYRPRYRALPGTTRP